ncbi:Hemicentin-1, partial [Lamellibrachia satsuma]
YCTVDGQWGAWGSFSECPVTCGDGSRTRGRQCDSPAPQNGGRPCAGDATHQVACSLDPCPVDGNWGPWSLMTACSTTCGPGNKTRTRTCTNPAPAGGGNECVGTNHEVKACNVLTCPGESVL